MRLERHQHAGPPGRAGPRRDLAQHGQWPRCTPSNDPDGDHACPRRAAAAESSRGLEHHHGVPPAVALPRPPRSAGRLRPERPPSSPVSGGHRPAMRDRAHSLRRRAPPRACRRAAPAARAAATPSRARRAAPRRRRRNAPIASRRSSPQCATDPEPLTEVARHAPARTCRPRPRLDRHDRRRPSSSVDRDAPSPSRGSSSGDSTAPGERVARASRRPACAEYAGGRCG